MLTIPSTIYAFQIINENIAQYQDRDRRNFPYPSS